MTRAQALAVVAGLLALAAALALPAGAVEPACSALGATRIVQNDAGSGRDAGESPEGAVPILEEQYVWGFLDEVVYPAIATGAGDLDDWFTAAVPAGPRDVSFGIVARPWYTIGLPPEVPYPYPPLPGYYLEAWKPGATTSIPASSLGGNVTLPNDAAGTWLFHAYVTPFAAAPVCAAPAELPSTGLIPEEAQDYGVYFGCDPVCLPGSQGMAGIDL